MKCGNWIHNDKFKCPFDSKKRRCKIIPFYTCRVLQKMNEQVVKIE